MTYFYRTYSWSSQGDNQGVSENTINLWKHLADKKNWRITKLANGYYQTECKHVTENTWHDVTRRETVEGAEAAIDGSIDHFSKKLEATKGPKVIKTFDNE